MNFKTKIQLFILPMLFAYLIFFFYGEYFIEKKSLTNKRTNEVKKRFNENFVDVFSQIENYSKVNKIDIVNISKNKEVVKIIAKSKLSQSKKLIQYIENLNKFTKIEKLNLSKMENSADYLYELNISFENYYDKKLKKIDFYEDEKKDGFKLSAIIDSYAVLNDKLIELNEKIDGYELYNISMNYVLLKKDDEILKVEIIHEKAK